VSVIYEKIKNFWNEQPCGSNLSKLPMGSYEYFEEFDDFYEQLYPYLSPFLDFQSMKNKVVMEIGIGTGYTLHRSSEVANTCYGLDISDKTIELNRMRKDVYKLNIEFINASATSIPLPDNSVDTVVSIGCLHHIPDIDKAISEIYRVLKPGGVFKGMVYNKNSYRFLVYIPIVRRYKKRWKGKTWQECVNEMYDGRGNPYGMVYSKQDVSKMLSKFRDLKMEIKNFEGYEFIPLYPKFGASIPRNFWLATLGRVLGLDLYFTARK
jgi:ubiquinone/menaquinone biosynthesis C-methylase UbiE